MLRSRTNTSGQETCRRLIEVAGQVFAERGLHGATIKEITQRAGANVASVNYHFRDKTALYAEVIRHVLSQSLTMPRAEDLTGSPEERLRAFVLHVIREVFDPHLPRWRAALLAHEFVQPTAALDAIMDELIKPRAELIRGLIRDLLGPEASEAEVSRGLFSMVAQCFHYLYSGEVLRRLEPELARPGMHRELADHIVEFSLAGLRAMRERIVQEHGQIDHTKESSA